MHPPYTPQALLEDMKMLEDEFGLAEMATPERDDDPNSLNGDFHDPRDPHDPHTAAARPCAHPPHSTDTLSTLSLSHSPHQAPRGAAGREQLRVPFYTLASRRSQCWTLSEVSVTLRTRTTGCSSNRSSTRSQASRRWRRSARCRC